MNIKTRLIGFALVSLLFSALLGGAGIWSGRQTGAAVEKNALSTTAMRNHMEADMMHDALRADVLSAALAGLQRKADERAAIEKDLAEHSRTFTNAMQENAALPLSPELLRSIAAIRPQVDAYMKESQALAALAFAHPETLETELPRFLKIFSDLEPRMETLSDQIENETRESTLSAQQAASFAEKLSAALVLTAALCLGVLALLLVVSVLGSLAKVGRAIEHLNDGKADLQQRVPELDGEFKRVGAALNQFLDNISGVMRRVSGSADAIAAATQQLANGNVDLSARTESQAGSIEETASTMEQLTATVRNNADNASSANGLVTKASDVARRGGGVVVEVVRTMTSIKESSSKIVDIIGVIDSIAFQTNILALNAAVESARAGEQGKGFAIVATEVRNLAQRSAGAAKEIKQLIGDSVARIDAGSLLVDEAGNAMRDIVTSVEEVAAIMNDISTASLEQSTAIAQVHESITELDRITQQNAQMVSDQTDATSTLRQQAEELASTISVFSGAAPVRAGAGPAPGLRRRIRGQSAALLYG
jgi:methyl-accepting chemotaxis protein